VRWAAPGADKGVAAVGSKTLLMPRYCRTLDPWRTHLASSRDTVRIVPLVHAPSVRDNNGCCSKMYQLLSVEKRIAHNEFSVQSCPVGGESTVTLPALIGALQGGAFHLVSSENSE
jgi:hypothetical protein